MVINNENRIPKESVLFFMREIGFKKRILQDILGWTMLTLSLFKARFFGQRTFPDFLSVS